MKSKKISEAATTIGKMYSITPNSPNINHLICTPTLPARLKLLKSRITATANDSNTSTSSRSWFAACCFALVVRFLFPAGEVFFFTAVVFALFFEDLAVLLRPPDAI
ncbi:MAG: hypothetical protein ACLTH3_11825 [Lachnospira sp.]